MQTLYQLRKALGLTQRELAAFTGIEHTQLHRMEHGDRPPSAGLLLTLVRLQQAACTQPGSVAAPCLHPDTIARWQNHAAFCREKAYRLRKKLCTLETKAAKCRALMHGAAFLSALPALSAKQQRWIDERQYQAGISLTGCNEGIQTELRIRIALLEKEAEMYAGAAEGKEVV
jgi:transcriptional regulator with XRE-family HTH domain